MSSFARHEPPHTHVQSESNSGVRQQSERSDPAKRIERLESLSEGDDAGVDTGADGCVVVEGDEGVHLWQEGR